MMIHIAGLGPGDPGSITLDTLELLRSTGVNYAQGYGIARPQPFYDPPPRSARQHPAAQQ